MTTQATLQNRAQHYNLQQYSANSGLSVFSVIGFPRSVLLCPGGQQSCCPPADMKPFANTEQPPLTTVGNHILSAVTALVTVGLQQMIML